MKTDFFFSWQKAMLVISILVSLLILTGVGNADDHTCIHCGMMKAKFGHSWVTIEHEDDTIEGVCSVHCAAYSAWQNHTTHAELNHTTSNPKRLSC